MIEIKKPEAYGFLAAIRGMRNPMNSWDRIDSHMNPDGTVYIGPNDYGLMQKLAMAGSEHRKYLRQITVSMDITAPLYWWKEFDTYKVGTTANSCSTMHKIHSRPLTVDDFSHEHLCLYDHDGEICRDFLGTLEDLVDELNVARDLYLETGDKKWWWQMIQLLPSSYNQQRTVTMNYEVLVGMYRQRGAHKLDEWRTFCEFIERELPYPEFITLNFSSVNRFEE